MYRVDYHAARRAGLAAAAAAIAAHVDRARVLDQRATQGARA
jgi:hypothetical protein